MIAASVKFNFNLTIGCPKDYRPNQLILKWLKECKKKITIFDDVIKAAKNADVILTDKVISINDKVNKKKKLAKFKNFTVTEKVIKKAKKNCIFLHCLPRGLEVEESVFTSKQSKVWHQAANRVHVQKSIILYCLGKLR